MYCDPDGFRWHSFPASVEGAHRHIFRCQAVQLVSKHASGWFGPASIEPGTGASAPVYMHVAVILHLPGDRIREAQLVVDPKRQVWMEVVGDSARWFPSETRLHLDLGQQDWDAISAAIQADAKH